MPSIDRDECEAFVGGSKTGNAIKSSPDQSDVSFDQFRGDENENKLRNHQAQSKQLSRKQQSSIKWLIKLMLMSCLGPLMLSIVSADYLERSP